MTVATFTDSANRLTYTADSSTAGFTFNFDIADEDSIEVYVNNVLKSKTTDYTVSFNSGTSGTGSINFNSAPSASATTCDAPVEVQLVIGAVIFAVPAPDNA